MIYSFLASNIAYDLFDTGLANMLGLETLRHGTNLIDNLRIRIVGGDPSHGGKTSGSAYESSSKGETKGYFYIFRDSEFKYKFKSKDNIERTFNLTDPIDLFALVITIKGIGNRIVPHLHATLSGYSFVSQWIKKEQSTLTKRVITFFACVSGISSLLLSPTLRFRFSEIDSTRLENDGEYHSIAYRTKQIIEPWRIGLLGSLLTGINLKWFSRVRRNPLKTLTGIVQITSAVAMTALCLGTVLANPHLAVPAIAGILLA